MDVECEEMEVFVKPRGRYGEKYSKEDLREALEKVQNNEMSYGAASQTYNIPKATLHHKMRNPVNCPKGAATVLSKQQEDELADWVLLHADFGDPRTKQDIIIAAAEIARLDDSSGKFKNGIPTSGWMEGFLNRHPLCRVRTPQSISKASAINTKDDFAGLWRNIYNYFEKTNQLDLLNKPELWWNADETYFEKDKVPKKVIARRGAKRVSRREMGPPKANTTVTYAFSASGDYVEPLITLKDANSSVAEIAFALGSVGANYGINQTESGWTKTESFYYFVSIHLHNQWEAKNCPKPRILTIDGYGAHLSPKLFRWCRHNSVIMIVLYPGATPYMQMCDTTMFSPMKQRHAQIYSQWRLKNPTKTMNDVEFVKILKQINDEVIKKESIINGWRSTGLQPFNFNNLKTTGLLSKSSDRVYDFKGFYIEKQMQSNENLASATTSGGPVAHLTYSKQREVDESYVLDIDRIQNDQVRPDVDTSSAIDIIRIQNDQVQQNVGKHIERVQNDQVQRNVVKLSDVNIGQAQNDQAQRDIISSTLDMDTEIELVGVKVDEIPEGIFGLNAAMGSQSLTTDPDPMMTIDKETLAAPNGPFRISESVTFSELVGSSDVLKSQGEVRFDLQAFGIHGNDQNGENDSKMGVLVDKIRRDVKQLGLLCAASDKSKLVNILIINQQLDVIDPPVVEEVESVAEIRTIKSILKPPTMPQRAKRKRNLNLKVSYGVVTAKEIVQNIMDREAAEREHEIGKEQDDIARIGRENEIATFDEELKSARKLLSVKRSEASILHKEIIQEKKNKTADGNVIEQREAEKAEKDNLIKIYNERVQGLREKLKNLKAANTDSNKAVSLKRKNYELKKKEDGNKVKPTNPPSQIDEMDLESDL